MQSRTRGPLRAVPSIANAAGIVCGLAVLAAAAPAHAADGCAAVNRGAVDVDLALGAPATTRQVMLEAEDMIGFSAHGAVISLVDGAGAPLALMDAAGSTTTFKAPVTGTYTFRFAGAQGTSASVAASCTSKRTQAANAAFLDRRKALLSAREPDRLRIDRAPTPLANPDKPLSSTVDLGDDGRAKNVEFSVSLSEIAAATHGSKVEPGIIDFWLEGRMQNYAAASSLSTGETGGNLGVLYLGTRSMVTPDIMMGALAQLDRGTESSAHDSPSMAARGWMVGPYMSMKLGSGVVFDGRAAWGQTANIISSGDIDDSLTPRRLVRGKLTGTREYSGWKVAPSVGLVYIEDAVRDGATGATKGAGTGKVEVLPEVSRRFNLDSTTFIEPRAAVGAFVGFDELGALNPTASSTRPTDVQLKAEAGVALGVKDGSTLQATGGVESGAANGPENWRGRLQLNMPLGN